MFLNADSSPHSIGDKAGSAMVTPTIGMNYEANNK